MHPSQAAVTGSLIPTAFVDFSRYGVNDFDSAAAAVAVRAGDSSRHHALASCSGRGTARASSRSLENYGAGGLRRAENGCSRNLALSRTDGGGRRKHGHGHGKLGKVCVSLQRGADPREEDRVQALEGEHGSLENIIRLAMEAEPSLTNLDSEDGNSNPADDNSLGKEDLEPKASVFHSLIRQSEDLEGELPNLSASNYVMTAPGSQVKNIRCYSQHELVELAHERMMVQSDGSWADERLPSLKVCRCPSCGRRGLVAGLIGGFASSMDKGAFGASDFRVDEYNKIIEAVHPGRGAWYEEFFAGVMESGMNSYEAMVAGYKRELFEMLDDNVERVLELGIGTGPNLKYYGNKRHIQKVVGVDPNLQMAKFCSSAALRAGLTESQFEFVHGVGEVIPLPDASIDVVVSTLVLCSVSNVSATLQEVKRVLKPGGSFLFIEHVAAPEGNGLRLWQRVFDPLQQLFADGCHLTRDTLEEIKSANFKSIEAERFTLPGLFVIGPHISGVAHTADL